MAQVNGHVPLLNKIVPSHFMSLNESVWLGIGPSFGIFDPAIVPPPADWNWHQVARASS